jgi:DNA-binding CsgD family transcriptional regulator
MSANSSIAELSAALKAGETSSRELAQASLDRVAEVDQKLGAFLTTTPELALEAADAADRAAAEADPLSDREREILRLLALGHTNQEIAKMLFISVRTAETHRAHIMQKLRLSTRAELVRHALAQGLLDDPDAP